MDSGLDDEGEGDEKGCSSANQGTITWMSILGLIGLSFRRRRNS